jgi:hypothetical protein
MSGSFRRQQLNKRFRHFDVDLADLLVRLARSKTVSDFGAGMGMYVDYIKGLGATAVGYDGTKQENELVHVVDLSRPCRLPITQIVMSIEVGEHIPEQFQATFIDNLCNHATELIVISWAVRGQRGRDHCSCRDPDELIPLFHERGWFIQRLETFDERSKLKRPFSDKVLLFRKTRDSYDDDESIIESFRM